MKSKKPWLVVMMLLTTLVFAGCGGETGEDEGNEPRAIPVEVAEVTKGTVTVYDTVTGSLSPAVEVTVVPKLGGTVQGIMVSVGEQVQKGQLLVQLDTKDIEAQVRQAEAAVEAAKTAYANAEAKIPTGLKIAQANYDAAKSAYDRMEFLYQEGGISEQQLESAKTQLEVASAQLADAQNAHLQLETLKAQVKQAEAAYEAAKTQLDNAYLTAPISGIVTAVHIEEGQMVGPSTPVITLAQLDPVYAEFTLTESQVGKLTKGDEVQVQVSAAGEEPLVGTVTEVPPSADPYTRGYKVKVEIANAQGKLKGGMTAQIGLALESVTDAIVIPVNSIVTKDNQQSIYLLEEGNKVRQCPVEILLQNDEQAAVAGEVKAGDRLVIAGQHLLQDGSVVKVVAEEGN